MSIQDYIGRALGLTMAPLAFLASAIRRDRIFHPDGVIYRADVKPAAHEKWLKPLATRLDGAALVRLSGALWSWPEGRRRPDLLGVSVRLRGVDDVKPDLLPGDQDLLFVTAGSIGGLAVAALATDVGDYLDNHYYTILPFTLHGVGRVYLRLVPVHPSPAGPDRRQRLALAVSQKKAALRLELRAVDFGEAWLPLATIDLRERLFIEDSALEFHPGTSGMGLIPDGLLQSMRPEIYAASASGRRLTGG